MIDFIVTGIVLALLALIIIRGVKRRKTGGCAGCSGCAMQKPAAQASCPGGCAHHGGAEKDV